MGVDHSGLANRYFAVRYMHLISGRANLRNRAFRIKAFLKAIGGKSTRRQKIPAPIDLLEWLYKERLRNDNVAGSQVCICGAVTIWVFSFMRLP